MDHASPIRALALLALWPAAALGAPPQAQVPVDEIVCRYSDDCAVPEARETPATRSFSFQPVHKRVLSGQPARAGGAADGPKSPAGKPAFRAQASPQVSRNDLVVSFENDSFELTPQAKANIDAFAQALQRPALAARRFRIEGHTNATGAREYNLRLSLQRATAVGDFLASQGVDGSRLELRGFGYDQPLADTDPAAPANRRVEADLIRP